MSSVSVWWDNRWYQTAGGKWWNINGVCGKPYWLLPAEQSREKAHESNTAADTVLTSEFKVLQERKRSLLRKRAVIREIYENILVQSVCKFKMAAAMNHKQSKQTPGCRFRWSQDPERPVCRTAAVWAGPLGQIKSLWITSVAEFVITGQTVTPGSLMCCSNSLHSAGLSSRFLNLLQRSDPEHRWGPTRAGFPPECNANFNRIQRKLAKENANESANEVAAIKPPQKKSTHRDDVIKRAPHPPHRSDVFFTLSE